MIYKVKKVNHPHDIVTVSATSTLALTNATLPYVVQLADKGWQKACSEDEALYKGLNIVDGKIVYPAVAEAFGLPCETI